MTGKADVSEVVGAIYQAAEDPQLCQTVLDRLISLTDSARGIILLDHRRDAGSGAPDMLWLAHAGIGQHELAGQLRFRSVFRKYGRAAVPEDGVAAFSAADSGDGYRDSRFYREVGGPADMQSVLAAVYADTDRAFGGVALSRGPGARAYRGRELALMRALTPHLARSARLATRVSRTDTMNGILQEAAKTLPIGLIVTDADCNLLFANAVARKAVNLDSGSGRGTVRLGAEFATAVARATGAAGQPAGSRLAVESASGDRRVPVSVLPLPAAARPIADAAQGPSALVVFRDPSKPSQLCPDQLRAIWGLTPAEAELALDLLKGASAIEHAERRGVTENTVRTHMAALKSKVGVSRMTELVAVLAAHDL